MTDSTRWYDHTVRFGERVVADTNTYFDLLELAHTMPSAAVTAMARRCGLTPPTTGRGWLVGLQDSPDPLAGPHLVWTQPARTDHMYALYCAAAATHPGQTVVVRQGEGWDDYDAIITNKGEPADTPSSAIAVQHTAAADRD